MASLRTNSAFDRSGNAASDSDADGSRSTDWNATKRNKWHAGTTCAQVVGLVLAVVSMLVMVVLMASASQSTYITRDLSWSRILLRNDTYDATQDVGLQSYTITEGNADVAQPHRYEDTATCAANLNAHSTKVRVCHECENTGDGMTGLLSVGFVANGLTVCILLLTFHRKNNNVRTYQFGVLTAGVCLISTIVSLVWWVTICHVQLGDSRNLHTGFHLCLIAMLLHLTMVIVLWAEVASIRGSSHIDPQIRQSGGSSSSSSQQRLEHDRRWEITGEICVDDLPDGYVNRDGDTRSSPDSDRRRFQEWKPPQRLATPMLITPGRVEPLYFPRGCGHQHHRRHALVGTLLACFCLVLGTVILFSASTDRKIVEAAHLGAITIRQPSQSQQSLDANIVVYFGMSTMGYSKNGQTDIIANPVDEEICKVLRFEDVTPAPLPNNCVDATGCSFCADAVQWFGALFGIAFIALVVNVICSLYRVCVKNSGWARGCIVISTTTAFLCTFAAVMKIEFDCFRMLPADNAQCPVSTSTLDHTPVFFMAIILIVLLLFETVIQYLTGHQLIEVLEPC